MSQHGCPERLSNRSKGFQEEGGSGSQPTMEVLVETLTGTAFEMTVSPSDTIFAIKSKICRVEGIPVSQQHLVYNLRELEDAASLRALGIVDGARLRLVLRMRGGPVSSRRLPTAAHAAPDHYRDLDQLLDNRDDDWGCGDGASAGESGCRVTVVVFREGERVNMLRVRHNPDGTYSPIDHHNYSSSPSTLSQALAGERSAESSSGGSVGAVGTGKVGAGKVVNGAVGTGGVGGAGSLQQNAVTMGKMLELRRRMESLSIHRHNTTGEKADIQKTRSEETLAGPRMCVGVGKVGGVGGSYNALDGELEPFPAPSFPDSLYHPARSLSDTLADADRLGVTETVPLRMSRGGAGGGAVGGEQPILEDGDMATLPTADYGPLVGGEGHAWRGRGFGSQSTLGGGGGAGGGGGGGGPPWLVQCAPPAAALLSSSTSDLAALRRHRLLPALARHRNTEHLHLSDDALHVVRDLSAGAGPPAAADRQPEPAAATKADTKERKVSRSRCGWCRCRLSIATLHRCRCGAAFCAPHRYAEVHGCLYDYKAQQPHSTLQSLAAPKLPKI